MTTLLLIRHAAHDLLGRALAGRAPGTHINAAGLRQAEVLADHLLGSGISALYSSPAERAIETAGPIASALGLSVRIEPGVDEVDFGAWTMKTFKDLSPDKGWSEWNTCRHTARCPGGESMGEAQTRIVAAIDRLARARDGTTIALLSHADMIKAALMHFLGLSLDRILTFEISPASVSIFQVSSSHAVALGINLDAQPLEVRLAG